MGEEPVCPTGLADAVTRQNEVMFAETLPKGQGLTSLPNEVTWRRKRMRFWAGTMAGQCSRDCRGFGSLGSSASGTHTRVTVPLRHQPTHL